MTRCYLSLGSNIDRENNIRQAIESLRNIFSEVMLSPVYESEAVGFDGDNFYNLIARVETDLSLTRLSKALKQVEDVLGRDRSAARFSSRSMDIDIVMYGEACGIYEQIELPRPELYYNAFVLMPMADLAPSLRDPKSGQTMSSLLENLETGQRLWQINLNLE